jgi:hypothetical protein
VCKGAHNPSGLEWLSSRLNWRVRLKLGQAAKCGLSLFLPIAGTEPYENCENHVRGKTT